MTATLIETMHETDGADASGVAVLLTGVLPEGAIVGFAADWAAGTDQRLVLLETFSDAPDAPDAPGAPDAPRRPRVRTRRIARMVSELHPGVSQSIRVVPGTGADVLSSPPRQVSCLIAANPFPARPDLWRPITAPHCPIVLVPPDAVPADSRAPVALLLDGAGADTATVAFAFAYAHRVRRSLRALIVGEGPDPSPALRTLGLVAGCYPRVPFDVVGRPRCDAHGLTGAASGAALVVTSVTPGERPTVACGCDLAEVVAGVGRPLALLGASA